MIESLESRRLFAVTVSEAYPGYYEVYGDESDDVIDIAVSQYNESFAIGEDTYYGVCFIYVHAGAGDDAISLISEDGSGLIAASVCAGDGSDTVVLNFDGSVWAGDGNDVLQISDAFRGEVYAGTGDDQIYVSGACVDPHIRAGDGDDLIDASANHYAVSAYGDDGSDTIYGSELGDTLRGGTGADFVYGGGGNDHFYVVDMEADSIFGGEGFDTTYANSTEAVIGEDVEFVQNA